MRGQRDREKETCEDPRQLSPVLFGCKNPVNNSLWRRTASSGALVASLRTGPCVRYSLCVFHFDATGTRFIHEFPDSPFVK